MSGKPLADRFEGRPVIAHEVGLRVNADLENLFGLSKRGSTLRISGLKDNGRGLRHPLLFIAVQIESRADECVRHHAERLRSLIGDLALVDRCVAPASTCPCSRRNGSALSSFRKCRDVRGRGYAPSIWRKWLVRRPHQCQFPSMHRR